MEVIVRPHGDAACVFAARLIAARMQKGSATTLGLATGRSMERIYAELVRMHREEGLDFSGCTTFNLDEYIGLEPKDPNSYRSYMEHHLFSKVNIDRARTHLPDGQVSDGVSEGARYEDTIRMAGGIDLQLLGIGQTGHIGFNEPASSLMSRTRAKTLTPQTREQNAAVFGGDPDAVPSRAMTMGVGTILDARELLLVATGSAKAAVLAAAVEGPVTAMVSASAIQLHPACRIIVDADAAARLQLRRYYDWVFENEPEWAAFRDGRG